MQRIHILCWCIVAETTDLPNVMSPRKHPHKTFGLFVFNYLLLLRFSFIDYKSIPVVMICVPTVWTACLSHVFRVHTWKKNGYLKIVQSKLPSFIKVKISTSLNQPTDIKLYQQN